MQNTLQRAEVTSRQHLANLYCLDWPAVLCLSLCLFLAGVEGMVVCLATLSSWKTLLDPILHL